MIVTVVGWYCVTKLGGEKVKDIPKSVKSILQLIVLTIAVIACTNLFTTLLYGIPLLQLMQ